MRDQDLDMNGLVYQFIGIVEDRDDPEKHGRVRVRCFGIHSESTTDIPTEVLPWAYQGLRGLSKRTTDWLQVGDQVWGVFLDGKARQVPLVLSVIQSFNGEETPLNDYREKSSYKLVKTPFSFANGDGATVKEPENPFDAKFPFNHAIETESGHVIEVDDTPGAERIHVYHKSGSYIEMFPDGKMVIKNASDMTVINDGAYNTYAGGNVNLTGNGSYSQSVGGKYTLNIKGGDMKVTVGSGNLSLTVSGNVTQNISGSMSIKCGGVFSVKAPKILLN